MPTELLNEAPITQDDVLNNLIVDIVTKLSIIQDLYKIPTGWYKSQNNKIVILYKGQLPVFHSNIFTAIDTLIHQYNLRSKYQFIYYNNPKNNKNKDSSHANKFVVLEERSLVQKAIRNCEILMLENEKWLSAMMRRKIYKAIHKANSQITLDYSKFLSIRNGLVENYQIMYENTRADREKKRLKRIVNFFEKMTYDDYIDLH